MKKLNRLVDLDGVEETITIMDFRKSPGEVLSQVQLGKTFKITKHGAVVAIIMRPEPTALELGAEIRRLGLMTR